MRLIINTTNIVVGGGIQVSLSFIEELKKFQDNEYHIFLSKAVSSQIDESMFNGNFIFYHFEISPSSITKGNKVRKMLCRLEKEIKPDLVFTVFGPAYWYPKTLHVSGFANGWCYNPDSIAFKYLSRVSRIKRRLSDFIRNKEIKKADYLIVETEDAKNKINKYLKYPLSKISVVGNTYHPVYDNFKNSVDVNNSSKDNSHFKLLVLSAFYSHKNLKIINNVIQILKIKSKNIFTFYLTIKDQDFKNNFINSEYIVNLGPQKVEDCPELYIKSDALFLPTLLETFSANYPEAMIMRKPILTSDYDFAKEVCQDASLYFDPLNAVDIADKIILLSENYDLYNSLVEKGAKRVLELETSESRARKYMDIFNSIYETNNTIL